ncbi:hypothetical protein COBT_002665 [Conglomerata obtusa]
MKLNEIIEKILARLNFTYNRSIKSIPYEKYFHSNTKNINQNKFKDNNELNICDKNDIKIGEYVFVKIIITDKLSKRWFGPALVINIHKNKMQVEVEERDGNRTIVSVKYIRKVEGRVENLMEGENVV